MLDYCCFSTNAQCIYFTISNHYSYVIANLQQCKKKKNCKRSKIQDLCGSTIAFYQDMLAHSNSMNVSFVKFALSRHNVGRPSISFNVTELQLY
jgi:hypothetical protein